MMMVCGTGSSGGALDFHLLPEVQIPSLFFLFLRTIKHSKRHCLVFCVHLFSLGSQIH